MLLTIKDRVVLPMLMPQKGKFEDMVLSEDILKKVRFTPEQMKEEGIKTVEGSTPGTFGTVWDDETKTFDIEFTELESALIKRELEKASGAEALAKDFVGLYRLFVTAKS